MNLMQGSSPQSNRIGTSSHFFHLNTSSIQKAKMMDKVEEKSFKLSSDKRSFQTDTYSGHFHTLPQVYPYFQVSDFSMRFIRSHISAAADSATSNPVS
jgi:hypothetical protein